jgi:hypothetical protein
MSEGFSPVIFLYGMALVVAVNKAFTLLIWRTLPKPRPPLQQEMMEAWHRRKTRVQAAKEAEPKASPSAEEVPSDPDGGEDKPRSEPPASTASINVGVSR